MDPAHQRFHAQDLARFDVDARLVVDDELAVAERVAEALLEREALEGPAAHGLGVELDVVLTGLAGSDDGLLRAANELARGGAVVG